jgi:hypothetical protein
MMTSNEVATEPETKMIPLKTIHLPRPHYDHLLTTEPKLLQELHLTCKRRRWGVGGVTFEMRPAPAVDAVEAIQKILTAWEAK